MTQTERNIAIKSLIAAHTRRITVSKETARASLIASGLYTEAGDLHASLGGPAVKVSNQR
ncbi:MAG: hypothetical protein ACKVOJ_07770 [Sphingomonadaceae bacterium]